MGIPSYFSYITRKYTKIINSLKFYKEGNVQIHNLFMDCNSIIYDCLRNIEMSDNFENDVIDNTIIKIEEYIEQIKASNCIFIAFDGVAPLAKMNQQKTRRYKSDFISNNNYYKVEDKKWSTSNVTPGTDFMNLLSFKIKRHFEKKEKKYNVNKIIVSCSDERGEGEHKLFQYIRENPNINENMFLYGLDADLIMLSIFHIEYQKNIFIFREAPSFITGNESNDLYTLNIKLLCASINAEMSLKYPSKFRIYDYTFLCFLLGNDFLPHFPALNIRTHGITVLLDLYNKFIGDYPNRYFIIDNKIQWRWFSLFLKELAKCEHRFILEEYNIRDRQKNKRWPEITDKDKENIFNGLPIIYRMEENYICPTENYWEQRYYTSLFHDSNKPDFLDNLCNNYIEGLEWVFKYYTSNCPSWKWKYDYHYPPLLKDLCKYIPHFETNYIENNNDSYSSQLQLIYVLPISQYNLLPKNIKDYILSKYSHIITNKYEFKWAFCRYFWECHVDFPNISADFLNIIEGEIKCL